jgi:hypothetical protein
LPAGAGSLATTSLKLGMIVMPLTSNAASAIAEMDP